MDRRFLTVLGVSLVFALVVSSVFYQMTSRGGSGPRAESTNQKDIVVATRPLSVGVMVKPADVKINKVAAEDFPKGAFGKVEDVLDRPVISNVLLDEPILEGRLAAKGSGLGMAPTIPVGMRAVTVRVNDVAGVAGFVLPGMHVDVLVTGHPPNDSGDMTTTCLQNVLVLSAGQVMQPDAAGRAMPSATVTLLGTPDQAELLTLAGNDGKIQLVLRNSSDQTIEKTAGRVVAELYGGHHGTPVKPPEDDIKIKRTHPVREPLPPPPTAVAVAAPPPPAPAPPDQIIMIRGTQRSVETLPNNGAKN